ncbi:hypothetical protein JNM05_07210 [bacterium]|nr:hypothetical protein [bacterium]
MKNSKVIAVWFYLFLILAIAACGGSEGIVNSNSSNNEATADQEITNDGNDGVHHFDAPINGTGGN